MAGATALFEFSQGRTFFGSLKRFQFWCPLVGGECTNQALLDPWAFSHLEHGLLFYSASLFTGLFGFRGALALECIWEAGENSEWGIKKYRSQGWKTYQGDSVLNSMADIGIMAFAFLGASYYSLSIWSALAITGAIDLWLYSAYGDCLLKNILGLLGFTKYG